MHTPFSAVVAASIDGRMLSVRYRQEQFHRLQNAILQNLDQIKEAISCDSNCNSHEVQAQVFLALKDVRAHYLSLDITRALDDEYSVANGRDNIGRRHAVGIVYIVPTKHTLFYSVISALSAALAAGNCVILEVWLYWISKESETVNADNPMSSYRRQHYLSLLYYKKSFVRT